MLRTVAATRYVTPLREGGSLPAIVEADDLGLYVVKFRGSGQGSLALTAELIAGELGRAIGLPVPELVFADIDPALGRNEPDWEIRELLNKSTGQNLAMDYLPGSVMFDPAAGDKPDEDLASLAVWFDAYVTNVDRTASNPNMLWWHKQLYFIDHGAALYFHHDWPGEDLKFRAQTPFAAIRRHVLLPWASRIAQAGARVRPLITRDLLSRILNDVPDSWILPDGDEGSAIARRSDYLRYFEFRLASSEIFEEEAIRGRTDVL